MKKILLFFAVLCALFFNSELTQLFGITQKMTASSLLMIFFCIIYFDKKAINTGETYSYVKPLFVCGLFLTLFCVSKGYKLNYPINVFLLPSLYFVVLKKEMDDKIRNVLLLCIIIFFVSNCCLAFWEKIHEVNYFYELTDFEQKNISWAFRSSALLGHALINTIVIAPMSIFILTTKSISFRFRFIFFAMGLVAMFCFNSRSGILITIVCGAPLLYKELIRLSGAKRSIYILIVACLMAYLIEKVLNTDFGGRLMIYSSEGFLTDESSAARFDVIDFYRYMDWRDVVFGNPEKVEVISKILDMASLENGVVMILLSYGFFMGTFIVYSLWKFYYNLIRNNYKSLEAWLILVSFWGIGLTNPHLAFPLCWTYFFFCSITFGNKDGIDDAIVK